MKNLIAIVCALLFSILLQPTSATASAIVNSQLHYLNGGAPPKSITLGLKSRRETLAFTASVGESVQLNVDTSSFTDACAVSARVIDPAGQEVARTECAAQSGQLVALSAARDGTYQVELNTGANVSGELGVSLSTSSTVVAAVSTTACVQNALALDTAVNGSWDASCASVTYAGHYSQYYTITVPTSEVVTIMLSSTANPFLVLRTSSGSLVATNDNSGPGLNAMIARTLTAGTYTIEATTAATSQTGSFSLVARTNIPPCFNSLTLNTTVSSSWSKSCESVTYDDHYAKYYTIVVPTSQVVTITLSSATNAFLVLRSGNTQFGSLVTTNDNSGAGIDAKIVMNLTAGTYVIEATTAATSQTGSFSLVARTNVSPCFKTLALNAVSSNSWSTKCTSNTYDDHYAKYYTLTVPKDEVVTITLSSATNAFLVLRSGNTQLGSLVTTNDNSGAGIDAQIARTLTAGTYTIEATTAATMQLGSFTLVARTNTAPCFAKLPLDTLTSSQWSTDCTSVTYDDHYSQYYTLTVPANQVITITLSSAVNAFIVLRSGNTQLGSLVTTNDNSGAGLDAQIVRTLTAGTYTIEATTSATSQLGAFTVVARTNAAPCFAAIAIGEQANGTWSTTCTSVSYDDHNAQYYTLNVPVNQTVSITLRSAVNAFLVLRSGNSQLGTLVTTNDNSGGGTDAKIARALTAGVYTIEATTASTNQSGAFTLSVSN